MFPINIETRPTDLAGLHEIFEPGIVGAWLDTFTTAEITNRYVPPKPFQYDADLLFGSELAAGDTLDVPYKLLCFLRPGLTFLESVCNSLGHGRAPFQSLLYYFQRARSKPLSVH